MCHHKQQESENFVTNTVIRDQPSIHLLDWIFCQHYCNIPATLPVYLNICFFIFKANIQVHCIPNSYRSPGWTVLGNKCKQRLQLRASMSAATMFSRRKAETPITKNSQGGQPALSVSCHKWCFLTSFKMQALVCHLNKNWVHLQGQRLATC